MSTRTVSAVVVSYHTGPRLKECLYALAGDRAVSEIVLVDNGNPKSTTTWLRSFATAREKVTLISGHGNIGFGAGVNLGISAAKGSEILVINPDAVLRRGSVESLQSVAMPLEEPWIVGGRIFDLYGREERGPRRRELTLWRAATSMLGCNTWTLENTDAPTEPVSMPVISGAFFLTSKLSMDGLDGFDEQYFLHVEDVDLCRRCREAGGQVMYDPNAGALHYGSTSAVSSAEVNRHKAESLTRYFNTNAKGIGSRILVAIAMPVMRLAMKLSVR